MQDVTIKTNSIYRHHARETHVIEPWGRDSVRVRISMNPDFDDRLSVLLPPCAEKAEITEADGKVTLKNGKMLVEMDITGRLTFRHADTGKLLCEETAMKQPKRRTLGRNFRALGSQEFATSLELDAKEGERFYGLGEHANGFLDQKGCIYDLYHHNTSFNIPFAVSSRGYGFLWNCPAVGTVELGMNRTRWTADRARQIDYWVTVGDSYPDIMERYAEATGKPPMMPEWGAGFWQSKLRYKTQAEVLEVAKGFKSRGLPIDVIVIDYMHWTHCGEWKMDLEAFPDLRELTRQLGEMGILVKISFHPFVTKKSETWAPMFSGGMFIHNERSPEHLQTFMRDFGDTEEPVPTYVVDSTNPATRKYVWERAKAGYYDHGVKIFWLDSTEPGSYCYPDQMRFHLGRGDEMISLYPYEHAKGFYEGLVAEGVEHPLTLCRAAYAGSQRFGAAVWSGDIDCTFEELRNQVAAGLNVSMSGIPWWHTDTGGFNRETVEGESYEELLVRWFQYSTFTPILRMHGNDYDTEIWKEEAAVYAILKDYLNLRYRLRPYILDQMRLAHEKGTPPMRPVFFDFPDDAATYDLPDQYMFGPDLMVAPVVTMGARERSVYLPAGQEWESVWSGVCYAGGQCHTVEAPLEQIPLFVARGCELSHTIRDSGPR